MKVQISSCEYQLEKLHILGKIRGWEWNKVGRNRLQRRKHRSHRLFQNKTSIVTYKDIQRLWDNESLIWGIIANFKTLSRKLSCLFVHLIHWPTLTGYYWFYIQSFLSPYVTLKKLEKRHLLWQLISATVLWPKAVIVITHRWQCSSLSWMLTLCRKNTRKYSSHRSKNKRSNEVCLEGSQTVAWFFRIFNICMIFMIENLKPLFYQTFRVVIAAELAQPLPQQSHFIPSNRLNPM